MSVFGWLSKRTDDEIAVYLSYLRAKDVTEFVFPGPAPRVVPADPDDDSVVHAAVVGRAKRALYSQPPFLSF